MCCWAHYGEAVDSSRVLQLCRRQGYLYAIRRHATGSARGQARAPAAVPSVTISLWREQTVCGPRDSYVAGSAFNLL